MSVDELSQSFLKVLLEYGGDADTTTLRSETGMSRGQINHRYKKLNGLGWISISRAESGEGERTPPKIAEITEDGMQAIRSGDAGKKVLGKEIDDEKETLELTRDQLKSFQQEIDGMKNQLNVLVSQINQTEKSYNDTDENTDSKEIKELKQEVNRLKETVNLLNKSLSEQRKKESKHYNEISEKLNNQTDGNIDEELLHSLQEQQESFDEWKSIAELYIRAMRYYMQNDDDIDTNKYLEMAKENN